MVGRWERDVVAPPPVEGDQEGLRRDILSEARPQPPRHVPVDLGVVAIEDLREPLGLAPGMPDQQRVGDRRCRVR
jgi:hypothetical protein